MPATKIYCLITPEGGEGTTWDRWAKKGSGWSKWQIDENRALTREHDDIGAGTVTDVMIIGHGGNTANFLHMHGAAGASTEIANRIRDAVAPLLHANRTFRVQICNAGAHPNGATFQSQVTPAGVTSTAPRALSFISNNAHQRIDLHTIAHYTGADFGATKQLMTKSTVPATVLETFRKIFRITNSLATIKDEAEHYTSDTEANAFFNGLPENNNTNFRAEDMNRFVAMKTNHRWKLFKDLRGGNTVSHLGT